MTSKPFLTFREQAEQIVKRGMKSRAKMNDDELVTWIESDLRFINYYRFSAYWYPFWTKDNSDVRLNVYQEGTCWETIRGLYMFDRRLRGLVFDAISRIEIALRTQVAHIWAKHKGVNNPQKDTAGFRPSYSQKNKSEPSSKRADLLEKVNRAYTKSKEDFAVHHRRNLGVEDVRDLPIWVFVEFATFGNLTNLLNFGLEDSIVEEVANNFGITDKNFFLSCINLLGDVRNSCAHQARIWNRQWLSAKATLLLKKSSMPEWQYRWNRNKNRWSRIYKPEEQPLLKDVRSTAAILTVCNILLRSAASRSQWKGRLKKLLTCEDSPMPEMHVHLGFTNEHWHEHPLWK